MIARRAGCVMMVAVLYLWSAPPVPADPTVLNCSQPSYRQSHLVECNRPHFPIPYGGGPRRGGLLGLGIGGIL